MRAASGLRSSLAIIVLLVVTAASAATAGPPILVLEDGGIEFPDGTVLESAAAVDPPETATVPVDCGAGDTIMDALETPAKELTIQITGVCNENVGIRRSDVTLAGTSAASDQIHGVATGADFEPPVVSIFDAVNVRLENLTIGPGLRHGVRATSSDVELSHCVIENNATWGILAARASSVYGDDLTVASNARGGIAAVDGTVAVVTDTVLTGNGDGRHSAQASAASYIYFYDSTITGDNGIQVFMSGFAFGRDTAITASDVALFSGEQGDINWFGTDAIAQISGAVQADWKALLWMENVNQTGAGSGDGNYLSRDSTASFVNVNLEDLNLNTFSNGTVEGTSDLGNVTCHDGSDLKCDGITVTSSTCGLCPVPGP